MNCKYCGCALPTSSGHCPSCGRLIPMDQLVKLKQMNDPKWNDYKNKDTAFYKTNQHEKPTNKALLVIIIIILVILLIVILKGMIV